MCKMCGDDKCTSSEYSIQNTEKFIKEFDYLCKFARDGHINPVLNLIVQTLMVVIGNNIKNDDSALLKELYNLNLDFYKKNREKLK